MVARHGASVLSLGFVFTNAAGSVGGGIADALLGTLEIVACAALIALPIGMLTATLPDRVRRAPVARGAILKLALDLMQGLPTIIVGLFVFGLIVDRRSTSRASPARSRCRS